MHDCSYVNTNICWCKLLGMRINRSELLAFLDVDYDQDLIVRIFWLLYLLDLVWGIGCF